MNLSEYIVLFVLVAIMLHNRLFHNRRTYVAVITLRGIFPVSVQPARCGYI
jgi:hypothetical protein